MQQPKKPRYNGKHSAHAAPYGKTKRMRAPTWQLPAVNVGVEQIVRAIVALEYYLPDFSKPVKSLWDELVEQGNGPIDFVRVANAEIRGENDAVLHLHTRQVTFCAMHGVRAREVIAYLCEMKEQVPGEPERDAITCLANPNCPGWLTVHASIAAVYAAARAVLGLNKELTC